ncbi:MAG: type II toxin-antitoxin system VapC family toxin [Anaerolineae bacterium]
MKYLLDTNICIYLIREKPRRVIEQFETAVVGDVAISAITVAELWYGVGKSQYRQKNQQALRKFLLPLVIVDFSQEAAVTYGKIRSELERSGRPIGPLDTLIAAQAVSLGLTLVTNNEKEFARVPGLALENWAAEGDT